MLQIYRRTKESSGKILRNMNRTSLNALYARFMYVVSLIVKGISFYAQNDVFLRVAPRVGNISIVPSADVECKSIVPLLLNEAKTRTKKLFNDIPCKAGITNN